MQQKYREHVKCIHIDPPYNTATSGFIYKNSYQHSSWLSMMCERIEISTRLLNTKGHFICHIDENEYEKLFLSMDNLNLFNAGTVIWDKRNPMTGGKGIALQHEYILWRLRNNESINLPNTTTLSILKKADDLIKKHGVASETVKKEFSRWINGNNNLSGGEKAYRYIDDEGNVFQSVSLRAPEPRADPKFHRPLIHPFTGKPCAVPPNGFSRTPETLSAMISKGEILFGDDELTQPRQKSFLKEETTRQLTSLIQDAMKGKSYISPMGLDFPYCHPVSLYELIFSVSIKSSDIVLDYFGGSGTSAHAVINLNRYDDGNRKYVLVEMGVHFDTATKPRIQKVVYSKDWKDGKPISREGISHCFKTLRLESYEDTLNNLALKTDAHRDSALANNPDLQRDYLLNYFIDVETQTSQSLLNIADFRDPTAYKMNIKKPGSEEQSLQAIDLIETFNWLIGLWVSNIAAPHSFSAEFEREQDPDLPNDQKTRLICKRLKLDDKGDYWFRLIEGYTLKVPGDETSKVATLIIWRKQTTDAEKDNVVLQKFLMDKLGISPRAQTYDVIYINGSHTLPNPVIEGEKTKVRLIEEAFHNAMWSGE